MEYKNKWNGIMSRYDFLKSSLLRLILYIAITASIPIVSYYNSNFEPEIIDEDILVIIWFILHFVIIYTQYKASSRRFNTLEIRRRWFILLFIAAIISNLTSRIIQLHHPAYFYNDYFDQCNGMGMGRHIYTPIYPQYYFLSIVYNILNFTPFVITFLICIKRDFYQH